MSGVPAFIKGHKEKGTLLTPQEAVEEIINICPSFYRPDKKMHTLFDFKMYQPFTEMDKIELEIAIEFLHIYCLENFNIVVGSHKSILIKNQ